MAKNQKYLRLCVSDAFILYTVRKDNLFGNFVSVGGLLNNGHFETFERTNKEHLYRFKSGILADVFCETVHAVMDYQDGLRNCIAPIDYKIGNANEPDDNWVKSSIYIGLYQNRKIRKHTKEYHRNTELRNMREAKGYVTPSPWPHDIVLDTAQFNKDGVYYVYNLLVKPYDIESGYNPKGLATVEIVSFVSEGDADFYAQSSQLFKDVAKNRTNLYNEYMTINQKRMEMFTKITTNIKSAEK